MKTLLLTSILSTIVLAFPARADVRHFWTVVSPDHEQTFTYGTEKDRIWTQRGRDRHLALLLNFTNDPFVDWENPRQYDNFTFSFPSVVLAKDGRTYSYRAADGRIIPVATRFTDFFGVTEVRLLPNARLDVQKPHGYLSISLLVQDHLQTASD